MSVATRILKRRVRNPPHGVIALGLGHGSLKTYGSVSIPAQLIRQSPGPVLRSSEDNGRVAIVSGEQVFKQDPLMPLPDHVQSVIDGGDRGRAGQFDHVGIPQQIVRQSTNLSRHGGRKQQVLAPLGHRGENLANVGQETHVEHVVGLVEDQRFHVAEAEHLLPEQVEHASRTAHNDFRVPA